MNVKHRLITAMIWLHVQTQLDLSNVNVQWVTLDTMASPVLVNSYITLLTYFIKFNLFLSFGHIITLGLDIDECKLFIDNCDSVATCTNTIASFSCACPTGYTGDGVTCIGKFSNINKNLLVCLMFS